MTLQDFEKAGILKYDLELSEYSSMKTGGCAKLAFFPKSREDLCEVIRCLKEEKIRYLFIGNASNVLFPDEGIDGAVIFTGGMKAVRIAVEEDLVRFGLAKPEDGTVLFVESGASVTALSAKCASMGLSGLEFAYGIPGSFGGAIYMNAGAYGGEISDVLLASEYVDAKGVFHVRTGSENELSYRHSFYSGKEDFCITAGLILLKNGDPAEIKRLSEENMAKRRDKQPLEYPSCGSAFKRPEGYFAGALIEGAGLKGAHVGGAYVSEKHAGFIVNKGGAVTNDVLALIKKVQDTVYEKDGVRLEPEIRVIK